MNILLCTPTSSYTDAQVGGAQTSMRLMAEKLAQNGHNVFYISSSGKDVGVVERRDICGVQVILHPKRTLSGKIRSLIGKPTKAFKSRHVEQLIKNVIRKQSIDIVYLHYHIWMMERVLAVKSSVDFKLVVRMAGLNWYEESVQNPDRKEMYERAFKGADSVNYNTPGLKTLTWQKVKEISFDYAPPDEFVADIGGYSPGKSISAESREKSGCLRLVVATRFSKYQKRQDILVDALKLIREEVDFKLTMIGSGPQKEVLEKKVRDYGLTDKVHFLEFLPQEKLWETLSGFDLLCHPCDYEGLSKIIVESMMMGLPVLASNVLPLEDYVKNGKTGLLVENTPEAWAAGLKRVYENRSILDVVAEGAKSYSSVAFDPVRNIRCYEEQFEKLIE